MNRSQVNHLKTKVMTSGRYLEQVFETGFDTYEQFQSFCNMCENHVNMCNTYCKRLKPLFLFLPTCRAKLYKNFRSGCAWSVEIINAMIRSWQSNYDKAVEEAKQKALLEERLRFEHELAIEYQNAIYEDNKTEDKKPYCGFKTSAMDKPKRKKTNKKKKTDESNK